MYHVTAMGLRMEISHDDYNYSDGREIIQSLTFPRGDDDDVWNYCTVRMLMKKEEYWDFVWMDYKKACLKCAQKLH